MKGRKFVKMISIIVPIYNTEKYLRECLDSLLAQTYTNIEIILVDDGSEDNSLLVCQDYARIDKRVRVYHKENRGVSDARNFGIKQAKGEYISFCDSDDKVVPELYQTLYDIMIKFDVDRVVGGYAYMYSSGRTLSCKPRIPDGKYKANYILGKMIDDGTLSGFLFSGVNNSLYKKSIILNNKLLFDSRIKYNEDSLFSLQYMLHSQSIYSFQKEHTYFYRQHEESSTKKRTVGDKYKLLRQILWNMQLDRIDINFKLQMKRRTVTEALWQILDISEKENGIIAIQDIRKILLDVELHKAITVINIKDLNIYKKFYYILMKNKMACILYLSSSKLLPILSKYISR